LSPLFSALVVPPPTPLSFFPFQYSDHHRDLLSFPTRRSSDLVFLGAAGASSSIPRSKALKRSPKVAELLSECHSLSSSTAPQLRSEEHTSELQSRFDLVCRLLLEKKKKKEITTHDSTTED